MQLGTRSFIRYELAGNAFIDDVTMLATEDGQQTLTYKHGMHKYAGSKIYKAPTRSDCHA